MSSRFFIIFLPFLLDLNYVDSNRDAANLVPLGGQSYSKSNCAGNNESSKRDIANGSSSSDINDDPYAWSKLYSEEYYRPYFQVRYVEQSIDQRLANIIHTQEVYRINSASGTGLSSESAKSEEYLNYVNRPEVNQKLCKEQLGLMIELLKELELINQMRRGQLRVDEQNSLLKLDARHIHLARVLDSYGRYESGTLAGISRLFGSGKECISTELLLGSNENLQVVRTRRCSAKLKMSKYIAAELNQGAATELGRFRNSIEVGICLPNTCHSNSFKDNKNYIQRLVDGQFSLPETIYANKHLEVEDMFCINEGNTSNGFTTSGKVLIAFISVWLATTAFVTCQSERLQKSTNSWAQTLGRCMDLRTNIRQFIRDNPVDGKKEPRVDLHTLNVMKLISVVLVTYFHAHVMYVTYVVDLHQAYSSYTKDWMFSWVYVNIVHVDTLFVISALLFTFVILKKLDKMSDQSAVPLAKLCYQQTLMRYLRFIPLYALVFWFKKSIWIYFSFGLHWDQTFGDDTFYGSCKQDSWLKPFVPSYSLSKLSYGCLPQAWSVSSDYVYALVGPLLVIAMGKKPKIVIPTILLMILVVTFSVHQTLISLEWFAAGLIQDLEGFAYYAHSNYSAWYTSLRLGSLLTGTLSGYAIHAYETNKIKRWPDWFDRLAKYSCIALVCLFATPTIFPMWRDYITPQVGHSFFITRHLLVTCRLLWATVCGIVFIKMSTDWKDTVLVKLFNNNALRIFSKLTFVILLIHMDMVTVYFFALEGRSAVNLLSFANSTVLVMIYSIIFGSIIHVVFEAPSLGMIKAFFREDEPAHKTKSN